MTVVLSVNTAGAGMLATFMSQVRLGDTLAPDSKSDIRTDVRVRLPQGTQPLSLFKNLANLEPEKRFLLDVYVDAP